jgi:hypothetical protein
MNKYHIAEIERKIAELEKRKPAHTVPSWYYDELEELEEELARANRETGE